MRQRTASLIASVFIVAGVLTATAAPVHAAVLTVTKTEDTADGTCNSDCSLREAIVDANDEAERPGPDTITFAGPGTFVSTRDPGDDVASVGDFDITTDITIVGLGPLATTINRDGAADRLFHVTASGRLRLSNATLTDGRTTGDGGAILSQSALHLSNVRIIGNQGTDAASEGGAIAATAGIVEIADSLISNNNAESDGGAIVMKSSSSVTLTRVQLVDNTSQSGTGGGIRATTTSVLTVIDSDLSRNFAFSAGGGAVSSTGSRVVVSRSRINDNLGRGGGGLFLDDSVDAEISESVISGNSTGGPGGGGGGVLSTSSDTTSISRSLISGNDASGSGGGVVQGGTGDMSISASTISGNDTPGSGGGLVVGETASVTLTHVTVANNVAGASIGNGGGLFAADNGTITMKASIVADNLNENGPDPTTPNDCGKEATGTFTSLGHNVSGSNSCATNGPGDIVADPLLSALLFNGGPTQTHRLASTSPALNRVPVADPVCGGTDQRGAPKPFGPGCDSGAYELVECRGQRVNIIGTSGRDRLTGSVRDDGILGLGGADKIDGGEGDDRLCGGGGNDRLKGGPGSDFLLGDSGQDTCKGGPGRDRFAASCETATQ